MTLQDIIADIHAMQEDLETYERNMASSPKRFMSCILVVKNQKMMPGF